MRKTKEELDTFMNNWVQEHGTEILPGAMLMKYGPEDYVGAALTVRGTLYFKGAHTPEVREAICQCFEAYEAIAKAHLTWLWLDEPPAGPDKFAYPKAKPMREMLNRYKENDAVGFAYIGGEKPEDASPWLFYVDGHRGWQAKMGTWGLDSLEFSVPRSYVKENPIAFQTLFLSFARLLKVEHGHASFAYNLSLVRKEPNESTEAVMASKMNALDVGNVAGSYEEGINDHIKTIGWLTAINKEMVERADGMFEINSELPRNWFAKYDYGNGIVIQAGPEPEIAPVELDPKPALYVLPNMALKKLRMAKIDDLHHGSKDGEPRLVGWTANQWLSRFDVPESDLIEYRAKLLKEPKLTEKTTLPGHL